MTATLIRVADDGERRSAELAIGGRRHIVSYRVSGGKLSTRMDGFVAAALPAVMRTGDPLDVRGPVSRQLLDHLPAIQQLYAAWNAALRPVRVRPSSIAIGERSASRATAALFSGGVDSFYTALRHADEVDALVFVHGFDIRPERTVLLDRIAVALRQAAAELSKPLLEVKTDLKVMSREYLGWWWYHGPAIASVALLLAPMFGRVYVPSSISYDDSHPCGSHPLVDGLWSTDEVEVVHDGFEANRFEKVAFVAGNEVALRWLRVCNSRDDAGYNCGHCEKCLRTMVALDALGALDRCATLPSPVDPRLIEALDPRLPRPLWEQNLAALLREGRRARVIQAVRSLLADRS